MKVLYEKLNEIKNLFIKYKVILFFIFLFGIITYGMKLFFYSISIDTEVIMTSFDGQMRSWYSIGRFGLGIIKWFFNFNPFNPYFANWVMVLIFILSVVLLAFILESNYKKLSNLKLFIFSLMIISSPILAEQFNFILQGAEIAIAMLLLDIGFFLFTVYLDSKKIVFGLLAIPFFAISFGCYQAFLPLFIAIVVWIGFLKNQNGEYKRSKENIRYIAISILIFIASYLFSTFLTKLCMSYLSITSTSYLKEQISWLHSPFKDNVKNLYEYVKNVLLGKGVFYNSFYGISVILVAFYSIKGIIQKKLNFYQIFYLLIILITPFLMSLLLGSPEPTRAQFVLPYSTAFLVSYLFIFKKKWVQIFLGILLCFMIFQQVQTTVHLFFTDYSRYEDDKQLANNVMNRVNTISESNKVIFVGKHHSTSKTMLLEGDVIGKSFFEWDAGWVIGSNYRIVGFMNTIGYNLEMPTIEEYNIAVQESKKMQKWPNENSIKKYENFVIVKLSE